jgi:hypothetical protein
MAIVGVVLGVGAASATPRHDMARTRVTKKMITAGHATLRYASPGHRVGAHGVKPGHLAALVGDRESGLGFYALPRGPRADSNARRADHRGDAIRYAIASEAGHGFYDGVGGEIYGDRHHHGIFNPVDGYGTPFFAGYYGPAGDPDAERGPFGNPY